MTPQNASERKISGFKGAASLINKGVATAQNLDFQKAASKAKPLPAKLNLSKEQKLEMVRDYMRSALPAFQNAPKAGETVPSKFICGMNNRLSFFNISGTTISTPTATTVNNGQYYIRPSWGVWCEDHFEGLFVYGSNKAGYYTYDPLTDNATKIDVAVTGDAVSMVAYPSMGAYNPVDKKIYALLPGRDGVFFFSGTPKTGILTTADNYVAGFAEGQIPISMGISPAGKMYVITAGEDATSFLYEVNTTTLTATKIGTGTGIERCFPYSDQSATFDARTGDLYWAAIQVIDGNNDDITMVKINTETGVGTIVGALPNYTYALSSVYYTAKNPVAIADFGLSYDGDNEKIKATFTLPAIDVNGDALTSLDKVEIVRYFVEDNQLKTTVAYTNSSVTPGQKIEADINASGLSRTQYFGIYTQKGEASSLTAEASVLCYKVTLPYINGFETSDNDLTENTLSVSPANAQGIGLVNDINHTENGSRSCKVTSSYLAFLFRQSGQTDDNILTIKGIPVKKGGTYTLTFWAKGAEGKYFGCLYDVDNLLGILNAFESTDWQEAKLVYTAEKDGQISFSFVGTDDTPFYIDDIKIEQTGTPARPDVMVINRVTPAAEGALKATVNVTLPSKTLNGETLSELSKISFYVADAKTGFKGTETAIDFTEGLTPGATKDFEITISKAGRYLLRGETHNGEGTCPYWSNFKLENGKYDTTAWVGYDKLPTSVTVTATPQTDGKSKLVWDKAVAPNGGYLGTVTYTLKEGDTKLYEGTDTTFTSDVLSLGLHTFIMSFSNGQPDLRATKDKTQTILALGGLSADMMYCNVSYAGSANTYVLNTSSGTQGKTNSAISQMMYPATGKAMYIDNLLLFTTAPTTAPSSEAKQAVKIYMGTTDKEEFDAFVEKDQLTLVYDGDLTFEVGKNTHNLSLKGFYYDGTKNLVISIVKPFQAKTSFGAAAYVCGVTPEKKYFVYRTPSTSIDFDTVVRYNAYTPSAGPLSVAMMAKPAAASALRALKVTVKDVDVTNQGVANAVVELVNKADNSSKNLNVQIKTNENGVAEFAYMPMGNFTVTVKARGFQTQTVDLEIAEATPATEELTIDFKRAAKVKIQGSVADKGSLKLADVKVKADDGFDTKEATTNAEGAFTIEEVYSMNNYTLTFEKTGMQTLSAPLNLGENDTLVAESFKMAYVAMSVPYAAVSLNNDGGTVVTWDQPAMATTATWAPNANNIRRFTIDNKAAFKYAQRFLPADLAAMQLGQAPKATRMGFVPGSVTAQYSIVIAADTTHEIYRYQVPAEKLVVGEWCDFEISSNVSIDPTKQLWLIVEVAADANGNQDFPLAYAYSGTTNPATGKGNLILYQNKWYQMDKLVSSVTGNALIRATLQNDNSKMEAPNGYKVYRGKVEDKFEDYTLLNAENVKDGRTYTDATYAGASFGVYNYAVVADYYETDLSQPTYTNTLNKDMEFTVTFNITSNAGAGKSKDAYVYMIDTSLSLRAYGATAGADGKATIAKKVWRDVYFYEITLPYHRMVADTLFLTQDTVVNISLEEFIVNPEIASTVTEGKNVVMNYGVNLHNWEDGAEAYEDFAIANLGPWTMNNGIEKLNLDAAKITWKNNKVAQSWIVMNPSKANPDLSGSGDWPAYSGSKYFLAMATTIKKVRHDLLVRPVTKGGGYLSFACRNFLPTVAENFAVVYSSTTADSAEFKPVPNGEVTGFKSSSWRYKSVDIPEDAKYVGIRYESESGKYGFMVDDLVYATEEFANPVNYELYLDGEKKGTTDLLTFTFENLSVGEHTLGVKAIYGSGASEMVTKTVTISSEAAPIRLEAKVDEKTALLTWEMPEGFTPKSYKVFLGEEVKAEGLTEMTYVFNDLTPGNYTAGVVAVYETGESEKATVNFTIVNTEGIEDVLTAVRAMVYPNPNNGLFYLQTNGAGEVEVYNLSGQMVVRKAIAAEGIYEINLQNREKGAYVLRFTGSDRTQTVVKLIVR